MPFASRAQYLLVNSATVVSHKKFKVVTTIVQFDFNAAGTRMVECIYQSFAANQINFISQDGPQWTKISFNNDSKFRNGGAVHFLLDLRKSSFQIASILA